MKSPMNDRFSWAMALHDFWGARGNDVAAVNPDDLRNVWTMMRDLEAGTPAGQTGSLSGGLYESACSPGANVVACWYRASILGVLQMLPGNPLTPWSHEGELDDAVFQIAATFPMKKLPVGLVKNGLPFDVQELVKQIGVRT
jgi:hypothetical protein